MRTDPGVNIVNFYAPFTGKEADIARFCIKGLPHILFLDLLFLVAVDPVI